MGFNSAFKGLNALFGWYTDCSNVHDIGSLMIHWRAFFWPPSAHIRHQ